MIAYDNVTEAMKRAKVTPDASRLHWGEPQVVPLKAKVTPNASRFYWGEPQVVPLKAKVTGTPRVSFIRFPTGDTAESNAKVSLTCSSAVFTTAGLCWRSSTPPAM